MVGLTEHAYVRLRNQILDGTLRNGERLGEEELAEALGTSRTPVREALRRLASEGLVEVLPNRGARVPVWDDRDVADIFELRVLLESHAARRAAANVTEEVLQFLRTVCDEMESEVAASSRPDLTAVATKNRAFHAAVVNASGSPRLPGLVASLVHVPVIMQTFKTYSEEALHRSLGHHREIVDALAAGDGDWAHSVMQAHVLAARQQIFCGAIAREAG
jgi:DNA-binding GntR family transcriptional regulator